VEGRGGGGGGLLSTGQLGEVMKESTEIAYTYAKVGRGLIFWSTELICGVDLFSSHQSFLAQKDPENTFFNSANIHFACTRSKPSSVTVSTLTLMQDGSVETPSPFTNTHDDSTLCNLPGHGQTSAAEHCHDRGGFSHRQGSYLRLEDHQPHSQAFPHSLVTFTLQGLGMGLQ